MTAQPNPSLRPERLPLTPEQRAANAPNRSGRVPGQQYIIMPDPLGIRAWYVAADGQLERGPSGDKEPALRNKMTRWGHVEVTLLDIGVASVAVVEKGERL